MDSPVTVGCFIELQLVEKLEGFDLDEQFWYLVLVPYIFGGVDLGVIMVVVENSSSGCE